MSKQNGQAPSSTPSQSPVHTRALKLGGIATAAIALIGSVVGYLVSGTSGLLSALVGAGLAAIFMGLTAASVLVASKLKPVAPPDFRFFGIVIGTWFLKLVAFIFVAIWLSRQSWLDPWTFFITSMIAVLSFLAVDVIALQTSRVPVVQVKLPGDDMTEEQETGQKS